MLKITNVGGYVSYLRVFPTPKSLKIIDVRGFVSYLAGFPNFENP